MTLTNDPTSNQTLGSANLDVPIGSGIKIVATDQPSQGDATRTDGQLQLRNLNLASNSPVTVTFYVSTPCSGTDLQWGPDLVAPAGPAAKQSNQFLGTGNDFTLTFSAGLRSDITPCVELKFVNQPAKTVVGATITDEDYSNGAPISVGLYSAGVLLADCPAGVGSVTLAQDPSDGDLTGSSAALTGSPCVATFDDLAISDVSPLPATFTLTASGPGAPQPESEEFELIDGTNCEGLETCVIDPVPVGNTRNSGLATGGEFTFVAFDDASTLFDGRPLPEGCANFQTVGATPLYIAEQRTEATGELFVTYGIRKSLIKKKYADNSGQQFLPLCVGAKRLAEIDGNVRAIDCTDDYNGQTTEMGWMGKELSSEGLFTGRLAKAKCDEATGFYFGIMGSFQDYTTSDPSLRIDPSTNPTVVEWTSDTTYRYFTSKWPSASGTGAFAEMPWDGVKFG